MLEDENIHTLMGNSQIVVFTECIHLHYSSQEKQNRR